MRIPREHGLYVVLASCWLIGLLHAESPHIVPSVLVLIAAFAAAILQAPARDIIGRRGSLRRHPPREDWAPITAITLVLAGCAGYIAIDTPEAMAPGVAGIVLMCAYLWMYHRRGTMIGQSIAGFLAATLVTPATRLVADGESNVEVVALLWGVTAAYFCSSIFAVRIRLEGGIAVRPATIYHVLATIALIVPVALNRTSLLYLLPMVIAWLRLLAIRVDVERWRSLPLKRIGLLESAAAAIVVVVIATGS